MPPLLALPGRFERRVALVVGSVAAASARVAALRAGVLFAAFARVVADRVGALLARLGRVGALPGGFARAGDECVGVLLARLDRVAVGLPVALCAGVTVAGCALAGCSQDAGPSHGAEAGGNGGGCGSGCVGGGAGASGGGAGGDAGQGGSAELPSDCIDISFDHHILSEYGEWYASNLLPGGFWRTSEGLHVGWFADRVDVPEPTYQNTRTRLVVSTIDPGTGSVLGHRIYDLFPPAVMSNASVIYAIGGHADGYFAAVYRWSESGVSQPTTLRIGSLDDPDYEVLIELVPGPEATAHIPATVAWDGEAFAVNVVESHGRLLVARVALDGTVLLPLVQYGAASTPPTLELGHKTSTDPISGVTHVFEASSHRWVSGHDRQGAPLPWATESGGEEITVPAAADGEPIPLGFGATTPAVSTDDQGGAWLVWRQEYLDRGRGALARLNPAGEMEYFSAFLPPADDPGSADTHGALARGPSRALVVSNSGYRVYTYEVEGGSLGEPRVLVRRAPPTASYDRMDIRKIQPLDWQDETWVAFTQVSGIRVLAVKPHCAYPAP